jgi:hypothetical protein
MASPARPTLPRGTRSRELSIHPRLVALLREVRGIESGLPGDLVEDVFRNPAGVLDALAAVDAVDDVPQTIVSAGGDGRAQSGLRVRPDEGEAAEDDA